MFPASRVGADPLATGEIPDYRFLPGALGLDPGMRLAKRLDLQPGEVGFGVFRFSVPVLSRICSPFGSVTASQGRPG